jgi:hypothetical protein
MSVFMLSPRCCDRSSEASLAPVRFVPMLHLGSRLIGAAGDAQIDGQTRRRPAVLSGLRGCPVNWLYQNRWPAELSCGPQDPGWLQSHVALQRIPLEPLSIADIVRCSRCVKLLAGLCLADASEPRDPLGGDWGRIMPTFSPELIQTMRAAHQGTFGTSNPWNKGAFG